jgi:hypothetical protein
VWEGFILNLLALFESKSSIFRRSLVLKSRNLVALVGLPLIAVLVACGGGGDDNGASSGSSGSSTGNGAPSGSGSGNPPAATSAPSSGGSGGSIAGANIQNACQLLTRDEVRMAVGQDVGEPQPGNAGPPMAVDQGVTLEVSTCRFGATASSPAFNSLSIGFERFAGTGIAQFRPVMRQQYEGGCPQANRVSGIGDVACRATSGRPSIRFLRDTTNVVIEIFQEVSGPDRTQTLQTLAQRAASRLQ